ncbi:MAG: PIN domain-containing protein [Deltaproteobacteria bacterium]|nr:PIN domain-containing protein [Deltaproteobacteria bacterium]
MVVADTTVWIEFFNVLESEEKHVIDLLIDGDELALVGPVLAELLQGCRTAGEASTILDHVSALPFLEMSFSAWRRAGEISSSLKRKGTTLPLMDVIIAALALEHNAEVFTIDPHFDEIPGLKLHKPK